MSQWSSIVTPTPTVHGRNQRRACPGKCRQQRIGVFWRRRLRGIPDCGEIRQIIACGEHVAICLDQDAANVGIGIGVGDLGCEGLVHGSRQGILLVRTIQREDQ
jgi:hypothetical protein